MAKKKRTDRQTKVAVEAGCVVCHGTEIPHWTAANAMAVAARHNRVFGHQTWARQHLDVRYGHAGAPYDVPMPGLEPPPKPVNVQEELVPSVGTSAHI